MLSTRAMWLSFSVVCSASIACARANAQSTRDWMVFGDLGVVRAEQRNGVSLALGHRVQWQHVAATASFDLMLMASPGCDQLVVTEGRPDCAQSPTQPRKNAADSFRAGTGGGLVELLMTAGSESVIDAGVGYRIGRGHGVVGAMAVARRWRESSEFMARAHLGVHYAALRAGVRYHFR